MRPSPEWNMPAVAWTSAVMVVLSAPRTSSRTPRGVSTDSSLTRMCPSRIARSVRCSHASRSPSSTTVIPLPRPSAVSASDNLFSRAITAAYDEIDWNCVTISENAPSRCENAIADCVITPNSTRRG